MTVGDLTPFGFWAFGISCFTSGAACAGWFAEAEACFFPSMLLLGGGGQFVTALFEIVAGRSNSGSLFALFGCYWLIEGLLVWPGFMGYYDPLYYTPSDPNGDGLTRLKAMNKLLWNFCCAAILVGSFKISVAHVVLSALVQLVNFVAFCLLITVDPDIKQVWLRILGYSSIALGLAAYYIGTHNFLKNGGSYLLPMGWFFTEENISAGPPMMTATKHLDLTDDDKYQV